MKDQLKESAANRKRKPSPAAIMSGFRSRLELLVKEAGSQHALAKRTGLSQAVISKWLITTSPEAPGLAKLALGAGVSLDWLLLGEGPRERRASTGEPLETQLGAYLRSRLAGEDARALFSLAENDALGAGLLAALTELATNEAVTLRRAAVGWGASPKLTAALLSMRHVVEGSGSAQLKARFLALQRALSGIQMSHTSIAGSLLVKHVPQVRASLVLFGLDEQEPSAEPRRRVSSRAKKRRE